MSKSISEYVQALNPKGYVHNREITNLDGQWLIKGSKNSLIFNKERVDSRRGMTLIGAAKTKNKGTVSSYDWYNSKGKWLSIKINDKIPYVYYGGAYIPFGASLTSDRLNFAPWWDSAEIIDRLLFVDGSDKIYSWSGAIAEVASVTTNTITKKKYLTGTTYSFTHNASTNDTINDSANGFITAGFVKGDTIIVSGSTSNDGEYTVKSVTAGVLELSEDDTLTTEAEGDTVIVAHSETGTWSQSRALTTGTRKFYIDGEEYTYTGGEDTGTLTGVTPDPSAAGVSSGDIAIQAISEETPAAIDGFSSDLIGVKDNYVFIGSLTSRTVYMSKSTDYTDFDFTSPLRLVTEGYEFTFDSCPTAFYSSEDGMLVSGGYDDWYKIKFELTSDHAGESVLIEKLKTATGQSAINQSSVIKTKNGTMFLSHEKTLDFLGKVGSQQSQQSRPVSDDIKNDIEAYDLTGANGVYYKRNVYISLPAENVILIYNMEERNGKFWQPPQTQMGIGRLALIDIEGTGEIVLCGHSANSDETFRLFHGATDNGLKYEVVMAFGYDNFGTRFDYKNFDELAAELYISSNTQVKRTVLYDYLGATDIQEFAIDGSDPTIAFGLSSDVHLGSEYFGYNPFGSSTDDMSSIKKARIIHTTNPKDFFERANIFSSDSEGVLFSVISYAENVEMSENEPVSIRK